MVLASWRRGRWDPGTERWDLMMAGTLAIGLIVSPHLFFYDLMILLVPFGIVLGHRCEPANGRLLGGGGLLVWSAIVWALALVGSPLTRVQLEATEWLTGSPFALQLSTVAILAWGFTVLWLSQGAGATRAPSQARIVSEAGTSTSPARLR